MLLQKLQTLLGEMSVGNVFAFQSVYGKGCEVLNATMDQSNKNSSLC